MRTSNTGVPSSNTNPALPKGMVKRTDSEIRYLIILTILKITSSCSSLPKNDNGATAMVDYVKVCTPVIAHVIDFCEGMGGYPGMSP